MKHTKLAILLYIIGLSLVAVASYRLIRSSHLADALMEAMGAAIVGPLLGARVTAWALKLK